MSFRSASMRFGWPNYPIDRFSSSFHEVDCLREVSRQPQFILGIARRVKRRIRGRTIAIDPVAPPGIHLYEETASLEGCTDIATSVSE